MHASSINSNYAFIDAQNLYMATTKREEKSWRIDLARFRVYLRDKYHVAKAFYFLGFVQDKNESIYEEIQNAGFILVFREHNPAMVGKKKGNVDSDIIFSIMKRLYLRESFDQIILVSGDGDYKKLVDFLIEEKKLKKILFPDKRKASSLYKKIGSEYYDYIENFRAHIMKQKKGS